MAAMIRGRRITITTFRILSVQVFSRENRLDNKIRKTSLIGTIYLPKDNDIPVRISKRRSNQTKTTGSFEEIFSLLLTGTTPLCNRIPVQQIYKPQLYRRYIGTHIVLPQGSMVTILLSISYNAWTAFSVITVLPLPMLCKPVLCNNSTFAFSKNP